MSATMLPFCSPRLVNGNTTIATSPRSRPPASPADREGKGGDCQLGLGKERSDPSESMECAVCAARSCCTRCSVIGVDGANASIHTTATPAEAKTATAQAAMTRGRRDRFQIIMRLSRDRPHILELRPRAAADIFEQGERGRFGRSVEFPFQQRREHLAAGERGVSAAGTGFERQQPAVPVFLGWIDGNQPLQRRDGKFAITSAIEALCEFDEYARCGGVEPLPLRGRPFVKAFGAGRETAEERPPGEIEAAPTLGRVCGARAGDKSQSVDLDPIDRERKGLIFDHERSPQGWPEIAPQCQDTLAQVLSRLGIDPVAPQQVGQYRAANWTAAVHGEVNEQRQPLLGEYAMAVDPRDA